MLTSRHVLVATAFALCGASVSAAAPPKPESVSLGNVGAVVSLPTGTLYLMDPKAGIVAVDLATNQTRWSAGAFAAKPLARVGDALIGADDKGAIRVVDARTGKPFAKCSTIPGLTVQIQDGLGTQYTSSGISDGKRAWISWSRSTHYAGGPAPTPEMEARARTHAEGVYEIDVATCSGRSGTSPYAPAKATGTPGTSNVELTTPSGTTVRVIAGALRLERSHGKAALPPVDLKQGKPNRSMFTVTSDLRHVIVGEHGGDRFPSTIFDVETGAAVADVTLPMLAPGTVLVGRRLVMAGAAVSVFDLDKQTVLWTRALRQTYYNGPYPP